LEVPAGRENDVIAGPFATSEKFESPVALEARFTVIAVAKVVAPLALFCTCIVNGPVLTPATKGGTGGKKTR